MRKKINEDTFDDFDLAQIEDFYKNLPSSEDEQKNSTTVDLNTENNISVSEDEAIHLSTHGLGTKKKYIIIYTLTALFCAFIIVGAYVLTIFIPGDESKINSSAAEKRLDESYVKLSSRYEELNYQTNKLRTEADEKKKNADLVLDYENSKSELRTKIEEKKVILADVNSQLNEKQHQLAALDSALSQKNINPFSLPPGKYTVGTNIVPGKYSISGSGKFMVASSDGTSKINMVLGAEAYEAILEKDDIIKLETTAKFTPIY